MRSYKVKYVGGVWLVQIDYRKYTYNKFSVNIYTNALNQHYMFLSSSWHCRPDAIYCETGSRLVRECRVFIGRKSGRYGPCACWRVLCIQDGTVWLCIPIHRREILEDHVSRPRRSPSHSVHDQRGGDEPAPPSSYVGGRPLPATGPRQGGRPHVTILRQRPDGEDGYEDHHPTTAPATLRHHTSKLE